MRRIPLVPLAFLFFAALVPGARAAQGEAVRITGEVIDTWCYFSGVMGGPEAVVGSAHHTCAMWCAAGGIPVGVLADDGAVYMVMKWQGAPEIADGTALLDTQSHRITVDGTLHVRDGINYLMVAEVLADEGIVNRSHEDYGVVPPFAIPELSQ
ncbi:hypothetical protein M1105_06440 [Limibaculum sp. FT325]|uniref:hypothetical protein n=1 Tax=Thermohalobaculum sediminis TaxID=2939436 RepID=UPI0020BE369A|nr:hypothetical protein [Limibaculum sediminis]MCL5776625.1 hypothetical protein [Limibaculum sediminis]